MGTAEEEKVIHANSGRLVGEARWKARLAALLNRVYGELARRQNPYFVRDALPHQVAVKSYWLELLRSRGPLAFDDVGLSIFSQNNEDGILLYIFSRVGFKTRRSVEIGCNVDNTTIGVPEGNSVNLIVNFGFHGLIIDSAAESIAPLRHFFASCLTTRHFHQAVEVKNPYSDTGFYSPILVCAEAAAGNINELARERGFEGEIDLLSIDIDGNDVRLFQAISIFSPRVFMIEVNNRLPFESRTEFAGSHHPADLPTIAIRQSSGASLAEVVACAEARGFVFVGMNNNLINACFVREDVFEGSGLLRAGVEDYVSHVLRPPESFAKP